MTIYFHTPYTTTWTGMTKHVKWLLVNTRILLGISSWSLQIQCIPTVANPEAYKYKVLDGLELTFSTIRRLFLTRTNVLHQRGFRVTNTFDFVISLYAHLIHQFSVNFAWLRLFQHLDHYRKGCQKQVDLSKCRMKTRSENLLRVPERFCQWNHH